jgi:hypothetical protein
MSRYIVKIILDIMFKFIVTIILDIMYLNVGSSIYFLFVIGVSSIYFIKKIRRHHGIARLYLGLNVLAQSSKKVDGGNKFGLHTHLPPS